MTDHLHPGPIVDGRTTWLTTGPAIPRGYQWRRADYDRWETKDPSLFGQTDGFWLQIRRGDPADDDLVMILHGDDRVPVTYGEIRQVVAEQVIEADPAAATDPVAEAVWWLLVDGQVPGAG